MAPKIRKRYDPVIKISSQHNLSQIESLSVEITPEISFDDRPSDVGEDLSLMQIYYRSNGLLIVPFFTSFRLDGCLAEG